MAADVDLMTEVLAQHRVWRNGVPSVGWVTECICGWRSGPQSIRDGGWPAIRAVGSRHQAEQVAEALRHGAPPVADAGADPANHHDAPAVAVPSGEEVAG